MANAKGSCVSLTATPGRQYHVRSRGVIVIVLALMTTMSLLSSNGYAAVSRSLSSCQLEQQVGNKNNDTTNHSFVPASSSTTSTTYTVNLPRNDKTAVLVTAAYLTDCNAVWLRHLVESAGMDVWLVHGHETEYGKNKGEKVIHKSIQLAADIPNLRLYPQSNMKLEPFDDNGSGSSKSSCLRFLTEHSEYDHAWMLEEDVFFTGQWHTVLIQPDTVNKLDVKEQTDFIAMYNTETDENWWFFKNQDNPSMGCRIDGRFCKEFEPIYHMGWQMARFSRPLAVQLLRELETRTSQGHHEPLILAFLKARNFTWQDVSGDWTDDRFGPGHNGHSDKVYTLAGSDTIVRNKLYHPVKCVAYSHPTVMKAEIDAWSY